MLEANKVWEVVEGEYAKIESCIDQTRALMRKAQNVTQKNGQAKLDYLGEPLLSKKGDV